MHRPTATALRARARTLLEHMIERNRWIYAVPTDEVGKHAAPIFSAHGFALGETDAEGKVKKWNNADETASLVLLEKDDLEITLVEAHGPTAPEPLGALLKKTGFYAQSALIESALDITTPDARKALLTLAHMLVAWDDEWTDLFLLHLASTDPVVRHDAVTAITVAAMVARDKGSAAMLLGEASKRESFPKLKETIDEALGVVNAIA